jgi:hypothetical protein
VTARAIMVFGTSSHVGKSLLTAALFRAGRPSRRAFQITEHIIGLLGYCGGSGDWTGAGIAS